tara:strand:+ start:8780 stop:9937 length:1158 start_codon:yes stop_codon:yes gene_type:complete
MALDNRSFLFTSESVSEGHPDKIADQISDAILDAILTQDKHSRVACETFVKTGMVLVGGEITTKAWVDIEEIARGVIKEIGYTNPQMGFDWESCAVLTAIGKQSQDISQGVDEFDDHAQGAGDQGIMFGYASNETDVYMPAPIYYAHKLVKKQADLRKSNKISWLRPDAKSQVTFRYENGKPVHVDTVLISTQHSPEVTQQQITETVIEEIIKTTIPENLLDSKTKFLVNPTGRFVIGGPQGDCGLTGRKIIVDTYGGMAHHGGGAFSGKDPSKVDRSAAYICRYIAKNIVAAKLAEKCEIQLSYAIGVAEPTSMYINTYGTGKIADDKIINLIEENLDLTPKGIIDKLDLLRPIYQKTASYGHFGRDEDEFSWEKLDLVEKLVL